MAVAETTLGVKALMDLGKFAYNKSTEVGSKMKDLYQISPTQAMKDSMIRSRAFIDGNLMDDEKIIDHILRSSHSLFIAFIINIIQKTSTLPEIKGAKTVSDKLQVIATETLNSNYRSFINEFSEWIDSSENNDQFEEKAAFKAVLEAKLDDNGTDTSDQKEKIEKWEEVTKSTASKNQSIADPKSNILPYGRIVNIDLLGYAANGKPVTHVVQLLIQIVPRSFISSFC